MSKRKKANAAVEESHAQPVEAVVKRINARADNFASFYANDMLVRTTPWDVSVTLGQILGTPTADDPTLTVRQIAEVNMSPQFAKRVAQILTEQIDSYERSLGPVPQPNRDEG